MPLIAGGGASPADVDEMALQSFRIKFLATRAAVDLPEKPIARPAGTTIASSKHLDGSSSSRSLLIDGGVIAAL